MSDSIGAMDPWVAGAVAPVLLHAEATLFGSGLLLVWLFVLGSIFGSFFNVVVYRLPLGLSLVHPASHCPVCDHPIRWRDNLPVVGWLVLGGRCRDCRSVISSRYPLVELTTGLLFAALAWVEVLAPEISLPRRAEPFAAEGMLIWGVYAYHLTLFCTLLVATLIAYDGAHAPASMFLLALAVGVVAPLVWPGLRPMPLEPTVGISPTSWIVGLEEGAAGIGAGVLLGCLAWPATALMLRRRSRPDLASGFSAIVELALMGAFFGWQAACVVAVVASALYLLISTVVARGSTAGRAAWPGSLLAAALLYLAVWDKLILWQPGLGPAADLTNLVYSGLAAAGLAILAWATRFRQPSSPIAP